MRTIRLNEPSSMAFIHDDFLLGNDPAQRLYHEYAKRERANRAHLECAVEKRSQRALLEVLRGAYTTGSRWSGDHRRQLLIDITLEFQALEIGRHRMASNARED